ncbi:MAG: PHP domain-containing protein [Idiomarina sp.]|nr:PHP domain-containing protein [Idiomarina sp.]
MKIDLHCHSTASDGSLTPAELVQRAHQMQVNVLALTDHDTVAGISAAQAAIAELNGGHPLKLISGIEFSCRWEGFEIHILGWHFDPEHPQFQALLAGQAEARQARAQLIMDKLIAQGVERAALAGVQAKQQQAGELVTRKHVADALVAAGYANTIDDAFKKYLGKGQCAYVTPQWCSIETAVETIQAAGGLSGLAHPLAYDLSSKWLKRLISYFKDVGGDALEVASGQQAPHQREALADLAEQFELKASVGSDFHFVSRWRELGHQLKLPDKSQPVWANWPETSELQTN